jgi:hypothetical protein
MNCGKGKGRAAPDEDVKENGQNENLKASMLSRVAASASGLTRSAFSTPNSNDLDERTAAALANAGKGQPFAGRYGQSAWAESSKFSQQSNQPQASGPSTFRTGHEEEHVRQSENEFSAFLDGIDSFQPSENTGISQPLDLGEIGTGHGLVRHSEKGLSNFGDGIDSFQPLEEDRFGEVTDSGDRVVGSPERYWNSVPIPGRTAIAEQENRDGSKVLALLSGTGAIDDNFEAEPEDENYDWGLSAEQVTQLRAMMKEIFPPPETHVGVSPDHPLNLAPSFEVQSLDQREHWREQWEGVLTRYTDEVWGGLLPLVKEARQEVEDMRNGKSATEQPKALRRLGAILGHLQKR